MNAVLERPSDFSYQYSHNSYILSFTFNGKKQDIMGLKSLDEVREVIEKLSNPKKIERPVYSGTCECLTKQYIMYEEEQEGIVFEVCTICNKPLSMEVLRHFNKDFDLDAFIAGET